MKKVMKIIKNIIVGILLTTYFLIVILLSTLLLNRNEYGLTQFKDKVIVLIDSTFSNTKYPYGSLVIVNSKKLKDVHVNEEIFLYETNDDDTVKIVAAEIETINTENPQSPFVTLKNGGGSWGAKYIMGTSIKTIPKIGKYLSIIESKWVFFAAIIVPCFFILLYEIYLIIIEIKFGSSEDEEETKENNKNTTESSEQKIAELMKQVAELQNELHSNNENKELKEEEKKE